MVLLLYTEVTYYMSSFRFRFEPDVQMDAKLPIHVDIVVGMPCAGEEPNPDSRGRGKHEAEGGTMHNTEGEILLGTEINLLICSLPALMYPK